MQWDEFSDWGAKISQWAADYHTNLRDRPVRAQSAPGEVAALIARAHQKAHRIWVKSWKILNAL